MKNVILASRTGENGMVVNMYGLPDGSGYDCIYYKDNCGNHAKARTQYKNDRDKVIDMLKYASDQSIVEYLNGLYWNGYSDNLIDKI